MPDDVQAKLLREYRRRRQQLCPSETAVTGTSMSDTDALYSFVYCAACSAANTVTVGRASAVRVHQGVQKFNTLRDCYKLQNHIRKVHLGYYPYGCDQSDCGLRFVNVKALYKHVTQEHGVDVRKVRTTRARMCEPASS
jgi:hypothetical protein